MGKIIIIFMEKACNICPRKCGINRSKIAGFCGQDENIKIAKVMLHHFEEPIISGEPDAAGSGAIFFVGCNLKCAYCQNSEISSGESKCNNNLGKTVTPEGLAKIFKKLEQAGALNINLVTPTHYTNQIIEALRIYHPKVPIVWNTSGYELPETIHKLSGFVDIFLTDLKYLDENLALKYSCAKNYPEFAKASILEMLKLQPKNIIENGLMKRGIIVRHLVLPSHTDDSINIIDWVYKNLGKDTIFSLMSQYVPMAGASSFEEINRKIKPLEYKICLNHLKKLNMTNAFIQDLDSAQTDFTPCFNEDSDFLSDI